jgi:hypothetical protein
LSKRSISVKKPAGWKKFFHFKCNLLSSANLWKAGFFSSKRPCPGLSNVICHIGVPGRAVPVCESVFKTPKNTAKKLQSCSHFALPPIFSILKVKSQE